MKKNISFILIMTLFHISAQKLKFGNREFEISNVHASVVKMKGEEVVKIERDLDKIPFDVSRLEKTVDEPTFIKISDLDFENGSIEVKVLSKIQDPSPFEFAQGFIGLVFNINSENTEFESVYLRPKASRSENQFQRNHSVQYFAYPDFKFEKLRGAEFKGQYETYADIGLNEWIKLRLVINSDKIYLYINNQKYPSFIVNERKAEAKSGGIGLFVDIGTIGYFKDLKVIKN